MIYVEDWGAAYGSPYLIDLEFEDGVEQAGSLVEDGDQLRFHKPPMAAIESRVIFIDGSRRAEAWLYESREGEVPVRGLAGVFAVGSVACTPREAHFDREIVERVVIWSSGAASDLPGSGSWAWSTRSVPSSEPDAALEALQNMMRLAEGKLAAEVAAFDTLTFIDGPLDYVVDRADVVGYVKTHRRAFLALDAHARIPELAVGYRTSLFALEDRYSCYVRIAEPSTLAGPWSGIVRLHFQGEEGLDHAVRLADRAVFALPRFAGIPHRDPRAPQNLQPIGALEHHLRHLMGDAGLAARAVRDAVYSRRNA